MSLNCWWLILFIFNYNYRREILMAEKMGVGVGMMTLRWYFGIINIRMGEMGVLWTQTLLFLQPQSPTPRPNTPFSFPPFSPSATRIKRIKKKNQIFRHPFACFSVLCDFYSVIHWSEGRIVEGYWYDLGAGFVIYKLHWCVR